MKFVKKLLENRGHLDESDLKAVREAGYSDGDITELVANAALNIFTNYTNDVATTEIDFPLAPDLP